MEAHEKTSNSSRTIFNQHDVSQDCLSQEIRVQDRPVVITHWNPVPGEMICLLEFDIPDCSSQGSITGVRDCNGEPICLSCDNNKIKIDTPGRYKLTKGGVINNAQVTAKYVSSRYLCPCNC